MTLVNNVQFSPFAVASHLPIILYKVTSRHEYREESFFIYSRLIIVTVYITTEAGLCLYYYRSRTLFTLLQKQDFVYIVTEAGLSTSTLYRHKTDRLWIGNFQ